jgi:Fur family ferric uptake transcriptional regulator
MIPGSVPARHDRQQVPAAFHAYLLREGLKSTRQRDLIVEVFAGMREHVRVEDLLARVKRRDKGIGYATVYRTLKLLVDAGLAAERHFGDGQARFEVRELEHHDHLICEGCGTIVEFTDPSIEARQDEIAQRHGFVLRRHRHELYGLCQSCRERTA